MAAIDPFALAILLSQIDDLNTRLDRTHLREGYAV